MQMEKSIYENKKNLSYYNNNSTSFIDSTQSVLMTEAWSRFTHSLKPGSTILDFGCGSGRDTKYFLEHGYKVEATDGSKELCKLASEYTGIKVRNELFSELSEEEKYDGVWACSSILHCSSLELEDVIKKIWTALKPEGVFYTSFKYGEFEGERHGRYFTDFTEDTFYVLIKRIGGFIIRETWVTHDVRPGREDEKWLNVLLKKI